MIQHPAILALTIASLATGAMLCYASWFGTRIIEQWDLKSGSEEQLELERRTYLISVIITYSLLFQTLSLFLYIFTADNLHSQFTGAMCAAGSLAVNSYGYPVLMLKIVNCLLAGVWLIINHVDTKGYDYPLIRPKYSLLRILSPLVLLEAIFQFVYFFNLKADIITSCCGSLFSSSKRSIAGEMAALPVEPMQWLFFGSMILTGLCGAYLLSQFQIKDSFKAVRNGATQPYIPYGEETQTSQRRRGFDLELATRKGGVLFSLISTATFIIATTSLITFISLYIYELPTHHCPFCILQKEYNHIGYLLYALLLTSGTSSIGVGALALFSRNKSLITTLPGIQHRLTILAMSSYLLFALITLWYMLSTSFRIG